MIVNSINCSQNLLWLVQHFSFSYQSYMDLRSSTQPFLAPNSSHSPWRLYRIKSNLFLLLPPLFYRLSYQEGLKPCITENLWWFYMGLFFNLDKVRDVKVDQNNKLLHAFALVSLLFWSILWVTVAVICSFRLPPKRSAQ